MRSKLMVPGFVVLALALAACGSSKSSSSTSSTSAPSTTATAAPAKHKGKAAKKAAAASRTYKLKLSGTAEVPKGAAKGAGVAVVTLRGKTLQVCWRFSHLHGFTSATFAHVHRGGKGTSGNIVVPLSTAPALHHQGCVHTTASLIKAIAANPHGYYVNIHSKQYPGGAVRSQL